MALTFPFRDRGVLILNLDLLRTGGLSVFLAVVVPVMVFWLHDSRGVLALASAGWKHENNGDNHG